jgi:hypothetical protein
MTAPRLIRFPSTMFRGFTVIEAFICQECGEGVNVERPVQ